jgi:hypothetical protein
MGVEHWDPSYEEEESLNELFFITDPIDYLKPVSNLIREIKADALSSEALDKLKTDMGAADSKLINLEKLKIFLDQVQIIDESVDSLETETEAKKQLAVIDVIRESLKELKTVGVQNKLLRRVEESLSEFSSNKDGRSYLLQTIADTLDEIKAEKNISLAIDELAEVSIAFITSMAPDKSSIDDEMRALIYRIEDANTQTYGNISPETGGLSITELYLNSDADWNNNVSENTSTLNKDEEHTLFKQVFERYKSHVIKKCRPINEKRRFLEKKAKNISFDYNLVSDSTYVYVDIWESIDHDNSDEFKEHKRNKAAEEVISHIMNHHRKELIGLMSLYPGEWMYRTDESFDDVCGENIAIDVDDLVLANQKICVTLGTYGIRGGDEDSEDEEYEERDKTKAPTDWEKHLLKIRQPLHASWPEHLLILEMLLTKKHTIKYASESLLGSAFSEKATKEPTSAIEENAKLHIDILHTIANLDAVKYVRFVSHKIMHERTSNRLGIDQDRADLEVMMERVDDSLNVIRDTQAIKQDKIMNAILFLISIAALGEVILSDNEFPRLADVVGEESSTPVGNAIIDLSSLLFIGGICIVGYFAVRFISRLIMKIINRFS